MDYQIKPNYSSGISERKVIIFLAFITVAIIFGAVFLFGSTTATSQTVASSNVKVLTENTNYDWGNIPINGGNVTKAFSIKNTGTENLKLFNVKTSCHCTKANITISGTTSPSFGMSGTSSWIGEIPSGKTATLTVIFDPAFHGPQGTGPINRYVSVETNASSNQKLTFSLTGVVIK